MFLSFVTFAFVCSVLCDNFYNHDAKHLNMETNANKLGMSSVTVKTYFNESVDVAIGTAEGSIYFIDKKGNPKYYTAALSHSISKVEWTLQ